MSEPTARYHLFAADGMLLYIGISKTFGVRWHKHARAQPWWPEVHHQTIDWYPTRAGALEAETIAIRTEHPVHNIIHNGRASRRNSSGFPRDDHPVLAGIRKTRSEYDYARACFIAEIYAAFDDAERLPPERKRELGPSAIGRAASFTREYVAQLRDTRKVS